MGKKSRVKKQIKEGIVPLSVQKTRIKQGQSQTNWERLWLWLVYLAVGVAFLTPFIISGKFYFPFVGPKGLFLMGCCQVAFFAWLVLAISYKKYRPRWEKMLLVFGFFVLTLSLSAIFGADPSRSFWSKFERMTGLVMWLHLFGFFWALIFTLQSKEVWRKFFIFSVAIGVAISLMALLEQAGVKAFDFSQRGGSTLGNTSFLGSYLLFNVFLAAYLFFTSTKWRERIIFILTIALAILAIYLSGARAGTLGSVGGLALTGLLYLSFKVSSKKARLLGKVVLIISSVAVLTSVILLHIPNNPVSDKFISLTTQSREVNWQMAWQGFLEKPIFGWGGENYYLVFPKYFNPCLYTPECGSEVWFDRTHNIVLDTLVANGAVGLVAYLGLLMMAVWLFARARKKDFWIFAVFTPLIVAYFMQNLTVFDMPVSLLMFVFVLGFAGFINLKGKETAIVGPLAENNKKGWPLLIMAIAFLVCFIWFVVQPAKADYYTLKAISASDIDSRIALAQKTLDASPAGKYQIRDFFGERFLLDIQNNYDKIRGQASVEQATKRLLDFITQTLQKTVTESPLDYSAALRLAQAYNMYTVFDYSKLDLAVQYGEKLLQLSPNNQQSYWVLSQAKLYQGKTDEALALAKKAITLEPQWFQSWEIAIQIAQRAGKNDEAKQLASDGLALALSAIDRNQNYLNYYQSAVSFSQTLGLNKQAKEIAQRAVQHNPSEWSGEFKDILDTTSSPDINTLTK
ncbi:MAG: O-antigen ligase family protein [Candidatus Gribaldobacteria bacterium]|nr:O-antigen ligase family protein [Candidatus Gribaldobacteria bacterium]